MYMKVQIQMGKLEIDMIDAWYKGNDLVNAIVGKKTVNGKERKIIVVINAPGLINVPWKDNIDGIIFSGMGGAE